MLVKGNVVPTPGKLRKRIGIIKSDINRIDLKEVLFPSKITKTIEIENPTENDLTLSILNSPEYISVKISHQILKPKKRGKLSLTFNAKNKKIFGNSIDLVKVNIKAREKNITGTVTVIANMVEDFSKLSKQELADAPIIFIPKNRLDMGELKINETKSTEIYFENKGKTDLIIHKIEIKNNLFQIQNFDPIVKPGEKGKIIITVKPIKASINMKAYITIISNDPKNSTVRLLVQGSIKQNAQVLSKSDNALAIYEKEVMEMMEKFGKDGELAIIDLRNEKEYRLEHIPGAINIEFNKEISKILNLLDRKKFYVFYDNDGKVSFEAVMMMKKLEFQSRFLENGIIGWKKFGFPMER